MSARRGQAAASGGLPRPRLLGPLLGSRLNSGTAEAEVVVAGARIARVAARRAHAARAAAPGPAAQHPQRAGLSWTDRVGNAVGIVVPLAVRAPLVDVAQHVIEPPSIRLLQPHRMRSRPLVRVLLPRPARAVPAVVQLEADAAVAAVPGDRIQQGCIVVAQDLQVAGIGRRLRARPAGILPLRRRRQRQTRYPLLDPPQELLHILPAHLLDGPIRALEAAWIVPHHRFPERLGTRRIKQPEPPADPHVMLRSLVFIPPRLALRRTHPEPPWCNPAHTLPNRLARCRRDVDLRPEAVAVLAGGAPGLLRLRLRGFRRIYNRRWRVFALQLEYHGLDLA